ncbi:MAG: dethiobiotin synthase [Clostridium sp.]|uniref:dethiobiotin synthase n=1 Tax=Clostridium sp. TaxID=1506 RepID=UPI002FC5EF29
MSRGLFITGTSTDIGKTYITSSINKILYDAGYNTAYYKPALSGADEINGQVVCDATKVFDKVNIKVDLEKHVSYIMKMPASPHLASREEGIYINIKKIADDFYNLSDKYEYITVEGCGGIVCPISLDETRLMQEDIVKMFNLNAIIVSDAGLGTINSTVLTVNYMKSIGIVIKGIILNNFIYGDVIHEDNARVISSITNIPIIDKVERNKEVNLSPEIIASLYGVV